MTKLSEIQAKLKAPKGQFNSFGKYKYRSCEDILEAVKPLLNGCSLQMSDEIVQLGLGGTIDTTITDKNGNVTHIISPDTRYYVKATVSLCGDGEPISISAFAREPLSKKGMDSSQITGTASSYARKYALNGLFCIDDTKDADTMDNRKPTPKPKQASPRPALTLKTAKSKTFQDKLGAKADYNEAIRALSGVYASPFLPSVNVEISKYFNAKAENANT